MNSVGYYMLGHCCTICSKEMSEHFVADVTLRPTARIVASKGSLESINQVKGTQVLRRVKIMLTCNLINKTSLTVRQSFNM